MPRKLGAYTEEILKSIEDIETFIAGMSFDEYAQDSKTRAAVERKLVNIGEALNQSFQINRQLEKKVSDHSKIIGFRNILVHSYFGVDDALVWDVVSTKLQQLKLDIKTLSEV